MAEQKNAGRLVQMMAGLLRIISECGGSAITAPGPPLRTSACMWRAAGGVGFRPPINSDQPAQQQARYFHFTVVRLLTFPSCLGFNCDFGQFPPSLCM
jgi:hypothetical protein